jgi:hypothetical protein
MRTFQQSEFEYFNAEKEKLSTDKEAYMNKVLQAYSEGYLPRRESLLSWFLASCAFGSGPWVDERAGRTVPRALFAALIAFLLCLQIERGTGAAFPQVCFFNPAPAAFLCQLIELALRTLPGSCQWASAWALIVLTTTAQSSTQRVVRVSAFLASPVRRHSLD